MALDGCEFVVFLGDPIFIDSYFYSNLTASECCFFRRFFKPFIITQGDLKQCIALSKIVIFHSQLYSVGKMKTIGPQIFHENHLHNHRLPFSVRNEFARTNDHGGTSPLWTSNHHDLKKN